MRMKFGLLAAMFMAAAVTCVTALAGSQTAPGVSAKQIVIGGTFPLSGPAAYYAPIPVGMQVYFSYLNGHKGTDGKKGVHGRQISWKYYDDGYSPPITAQQTRKLVEEDKVFALFGGLGTEPQQAVEDYLNQKKVPQVFVSTGATEFGNYKLHPWTIGWQPDYVAEGAIYGKYAAQNWPNKKIGVIYQNDDYGNDYLTGLRKGLGAKSSNIITTQPFAATDTSVASQVSAIKASGADVIAIFALPGGTITTYGTMKALNFKPEEVIQNSVSATDTIMKLALSRGLAATLDGAISTAYLMDPQNPAYANNPAMKLYKAQMAKFAPTQDANNGLFFYGFAKAWDVAKVLGLSGKTPSRSKLMSAARHINWVNPFAIPGVKEKTTPSDPFPLSQLKLIKFNSSTARWTEFGKLIAGRGPGT
jgi:branched-chain amino acid transport system substrate-binding protein